MTENTRFYGDYLNTLDAAASGLLRELDALEARYAKENRRFPVEHIKSRIKSAENAKEKLERLGFPATVESARENLFDLVGIRLVCRFFHEVYEVAKRLTEIESVEVCQVKDYIKNPKPSGYRSIHLILSVPVQGFGARQYAEVQIRTIAMDFWASLEHELKYKKHVSDAKLMADELKRCADEIISVDLKMQAIYEWLTPPSDAMVPLADSRVE